jgi:hypothetical protein
VLLVKYPHLVSFAKKLDASVLEVMQAEDLDVLFMLPLSTKAFERA